MKSILRSILFCFLVAFFTIGADYSPSGYNVLIDRENLYQPYAELKPKIFELEGALNPDGTINKNAEGYQRAVEKLKPVYESMMKTGQAGEEKRKVILDYLYNKAKIEKKNEPELSGTDPSERKGIFSDRESTAKSASDYEKIAKQYEAYAKDNGFTFQREGDYINIKELDVPLHRPAGPQDPIGSSAHDARVDAQTSGTETAGSAYGQKKYQGVGGEFADQDVKGKALDSIKKIQEPLNKTAETSWQQYEQQMKIAKEANRINQAAGRPEDELLKAVKEGKMDPDLMPELKETVKERALKQTKEAWPEIEKKNAKNIEEQTKKITDPETPPAEKQRLKAELNDAIRRQQKTTQTIMNSDEGAAFKSVTGKTPETSINELKTTVSTTVTSKIKSAASTFNPFEPVIGYVKTPTSATAGAGAALAVLFLYETWREKKKEQQPWESEPEVAAKALWEATGIPGAISIGDNAAQKALKEYRDCVNAGRKDCSKMTTVLKANVYAVKDAGIAIVTGIANIPNFVINTPLRWDADSAEETAKEMEKRVEQYRPIGALRKLALELSGLANEADTQLRSFVPLDEQAWNLQKQVISISSSQLQLDGSIKRLKNLCVSAKEMNKKTATVKNPAEIYANLTKRLAVVKQYAQQTCSASNQAIKTFNEGKIDEKGLESYKANIKSTYLDQAETQYAYAQQEMTALKGAVGEKTDLASQAVNAQKEFKEYMDFIQAVSKNAAKLNDDYVKKIIQLNATVTDFNNALGRFHTGVKYFYNEKDVKEQQEILEIARQVDALKIDTKSAVEHEGKIKDFYRFTIDVTKLAQIKPESCPEMDQLVLPPQGADPLAPAFEEAGKMIAEGRNCYANLKGTAQVKTEVSIRVSPASAEIFVGDMMTFIASLTPETKDTQNYFRWTVNNQESGNKGSSQSLKIGRQGSHTVRVEAFRTTGSTGQKIGEATYSLIAKEKEQVKVSIYISGPGQIKMGQSGTYTGMISETNVPESSLYFKWTIDEKEAGSGKTISFNGNTPGVHAIGAELWMRGNPDTRVTQAGYAVVVEGQPAPPKDKDSTIKKNQYEECISSEKKYYENAVNWFPKIRNKDSYPHYSCQPMGATQEYPPKQCCDAYYTTRNQPGTWNEAWLVLQECGWKEETKKRKEAFDKKVEACRKKYPDAKP
ncbi:MAG: hypothetical protein NT178_14895 [Proteobacteria bacterium]|nr:hypothetical protein [Pseudomonadota bacterium]